MKFTTTYLTTALCAVTLAAPAPAPYENTPVESHLEADSWIYWRNNARKGGDVYLHAYKRLTEDRLYNKQPWSHTSVILDDPTINFRVRIFGDHSWYQWVSLNTNQGSCINGFEIGGKCNEDYSYGLGPQEAITNRQADQWYPIETQGGWLIGKTVWNEGSKTTTAAKCLAQDVDGELITVQLQDIPEAMETLNKSGDWSKAGCNVYTRIKGTAKK